MLAYDSINSCASVSGCINVYHIIIICIVVGDDDGVGVSICVCFDSSVGF